MRRRRASDVFDPGWRSTDGLRRELTVLRTLDDGPDRKGAKFASAATAAWELFAQDEDARAREVARILSDVDHVTPPRNPPWTRDETILALDTYLQVRPQFADAKSAAVRELSALLLLNARRRGMTGQISLRNPAGVARKVNKFRAAEAGLAASAVKGAQLENEVWAAFIQHPGQILVRAAELRTSLANEAEPQEVGATAPVPSRGPAPAFGAVSQVREDGKTSVYLMKLVGPVDILYPNEAARGFAITKVGRSNDILRRTAQLNLGFPPRSGLAWILIDAVEFASATEAHRVEQSLLDDLAARARTLGGEFGLLMEEEFHLFIEQARLFNSA